MSDDKGPARTLKYKPPVESVADARPTTLARTLWSLAIGSVAALLLGSRAVLSWANALPIGRISDFILYLAQTWDDEMGRLGISHFAAAIREFLHAFEGWH